MAIRILIAVGGSGGHLFPAQQLAELLQKQGDCELLFAGHGLSTTPFFERQKIGFEEVPSARLNPIFPFFQATWKGFWKGIRLLRKFKPDVVVGFGSFHSFPVLAAAACLRKKIVLFEANCILGKVNRLFTPLAKQVAIQFPLPRKGSVRAIRVPLLPWVAQDFRSLSQAQARKSFQLETDRWTFLIFGGSQGATFINEIFAAAAEILCQRGWVFQVIHLVGKEMAVTPIEQIYQRLRIPAVVKAFEKEMLAAYRAADIAICRSGAGTTAELIRFEKPAILIPYPLAAEDHQRKNAEFLSRQLGGARMLLQKEATREKLAIEIEALLRDWAGHQAALAKAHAEHEGQLDLGTIVRTVAKNG